MKNKSHPTFFSEWILRFTQKKSLIMVNWLWMSTFYRNSSWISARASFEGETKRCSGVRHTWRCPQRPCTRSSLGTWLRICHITLERVGRHASSCAEALWGRDWDKNKPQLWNAEDTLKTYFTLNLGFSYWCSIWKLRCPLNQSLKADCSMLQVATS